MKIRVAVSPGSALLGAELLHGLESRGFDAIWLSDLPRSENSDPILGLTWAAAHTQRLRLGANVVPAGRDPFLLAKALAQVDRVSGGRVLLTLVPGVRMPGNLPEADARDRNAAIESLLPKLRRWWAGDAVDGVGLPTLPVQQPLELWLGGRGPQALERVGRLADGWLGSSLDPEAAGDARRRIEAAARRAARTIDPDHFGMSIGYARDAGTVPHGLPDELPVGRTALRDRIVRYVDHGISKFVVRPVTRDAHRDDDLDWLADTVLDLQT